MKKLLLTLMILTGMSIALNANTDECQESKENAESNRDYLERYIKRLYTCVQNNDLNDDCYSEFRKVKSAYNDFESDVSDVSSNCE